MTSDPFLEARYQMVREQIEKRGIKDERVLSAMRDVPRHKFVGPASRSNAYGDFPLSIARGQTISQPFIVAYMTEVLQIEPDHRVLEIGTGCGYQTAILSRLAKVVYSVEVHEELSRAARQHLRELDIDNVFFAVHDGFEGWPDKAPFDRIIVTAAPEKVPQTLVDQLNDNGRMVIPVGDLRQELVLLTMENGRLVTKSLTVVSFVPMVRKKR